MRLTDDHLLAYLEGVPRGTPEPVILEGAGYSFTREVNGEIQRVPQRAAFWRAVAAAKGEELECLAPLRGGSDLRVSGDQRVVIQPAHLRFLGVPPRGMVRVRQQTSGSNKYLTIQKL